MTIPFEGVEIAWRKLRPGHTMGDMPLLSAFVSLLVPLAHATAGCNAVGWDSRHTDVAGCTLFYPAIEWLYDEGVAQGVRVDEAHSAYQPTRSVNRAEFTKLVLLASGAGEPGPCAEAPFPDVLKDAWFAPYVCEAKKRGIVGGFPDGTFKPAIDVNFANGSKILAKTFGVPLDENDAEFGGESFWYRVYTKALLREGAVAETIGSYTQSLDRGEMAEMLYRLATGRSSLDPDQTNEGEQMGTGYRDYGAEDALGLYVQAPDPPFVFAPATRSAGRTLLSGYRFAHAIQDERCGASGMFEHCDPVFIDWSIGLYVTEVGIQREDIAPLEMWDESGYDAYFGGRPGRCVTLGIEGENTDYCLATMPNGKTLVAVFDWIDTDFVAQPGLTPVKTQKAYFARVRKSMQFQGN